LLICLSGFEVEAEEETFLTFYQKTFQIDSFSNEMSKKETVCVYVCVCVWEIESSGVCVCVFVSER